jgi:hypothetical protein
MKTLKRMGCCHSGEFWLADENGDAVAVIPGGRSAKDERKAADEIVQAVNSHAALVEALRALRAPAVLTASERRPDELRTLQTFLVKEGLEVEVIDSPMTRGYAKTKVRVLRIAVPTEPPAELVYQRKRPVEGAPTPTKSMARRSSLGIRVGALAAPAAPSKRELAGGLLRLRFNRPGTPSWWEVDAPLKKARLDWAYEVVSEPGYTEAQAPEAPASLL